MTSAFPRIQHCLLPDTGTKPMEILPVTISQSAHICDMVAQLQQSSQGHMRSMALLWLFKHS